MTNNTKNERKKTRAVFLDRDGIINKKIEGGYVRKVSEFTILPNIKEVLKELKNKGYLLIIITNQQGIGKGIMTEKDLEKIHEYLIKEIPYIDDIFYCPHLKGTCECRKPKPGLIFKAKDKWNIDLNNSWMIGDEERDIIAGKEAGCKTIRVINKIGINSRADYIIKEIKEILNIIK